MNNDQVPNMSIQDTENNNVDENSNDHQFDQYANYHNQHTNHQFQRNMPYNDDAPVAWQMHTPNRPSSQDQLHRDPGINRLWAPSQQDFPDSHLRPMYRHSNSIHRRNLSEGLPFNDNEPLPQLPRGPRDALLSTNRSNWMPSYRTTKPSEDEIKNQGKELLYNLAEEQFRREHLNFKEYLPDNKLSNDDPDLKRIGRDLRKLADDFARSPERENVKQRARGVDMGSITCENFFQLCTELFCKGDGGITRERIVVLFVFIIDVALQQVKQHTERFISQLMKWSLSFIFDRVCRWVQEAGGWGVVICKSADFLYKCVIGSCAVLTSFALVVYIKKNWKL